MESWASRCTYIIVHHCSLRMFEIEAGSVEGHWGTWNVCLCHGKHFLGCGHVHIPHPTFSPTLSLSIRGKNSWLLVFRLLLFDHIRAFKGAVLRSLARSCVAELSTNGWPPAQSNWIAPEPLHYSARCHTRVCLLAFFNLYFYVYLV